MSNDSPYTPCRQCGLPYLPRNGNQRYCSQRCKDRAKYEGIMADPERYKAYLARHSEKHFRNRDERLRRQREIYAEKVGRPVRTVRRDPVCTADGCTEPHLAKGLCVRHYRKMRRDEGAAWALGGDYRVRARVHGVAYEQFSRDEIFERDGWVCGICGDPVDAELAYPDPMSASLDHIVPMSLGGDHVPSNAQCSHLGCNATKGASTEGEVVTHA